MDKNLNSKKHVYFLVEGASDVLILSNIFPRMLGDEYNCHFYPANGLSGIISSFKPIVGLTDDDVKIVVVFDSDTQSESRKEERVNFVKYEIDYETYKDRVGVFCFVPAIDGLIPEFWDLARIKRTQRERYNAEMTQLIDKEFERVKENTVIKDMFEFVAG